MLHLRYIIYTHTHILVMKCFCSESILRLTESKRSNYCITEPLLLGCRPAVATAVTPGQQGAVWPLPSTSWPTRSQLSWGSGCFPQHRFKAVEVWEQWLLCCYQTFDLCLNTALLWRVQVTVFVTTISLILIIIIKYCYAHWHFYFENIEQAFPLGFFPDKEYLKD